VSVADDVVAILDLANRPAELARIVVEPDGEDAALVRCDPPGHWAGETVLGREVAPLLASAGLRVELGGSLGPPSPEMPSARTVRAKREQERASRRRLREAPVLRVRRGF
jgi:hypothetical protein